MPTTATHRPPTDTSLLGELVAQGRLAWKLLRDPRVPTATKLIPGLAVVYFLSPIDLLPLDAVLPGIGHLDDAAVLLLALRLFIQLAPKDVLADVDQPPAASEDAVTTTYRVRE
jgi:uncharacterized membrane protein YkvA (DUF1232 family)